MRVPPCYDDVVRGLGEALFSDVTGLAVPEVLRETSFHPPEKMHAAAWRYDEFLRMVSRQSHLSLSQPSFHF